MTDDAEISNEEIREIWDRKAAFWDDYMKEGNRHSKELVWPAQERLLALRRGESVAGGSVRKRQLRAADGESGRERGRLRTSRRSSSIGPGLGQSKTPT